MPSIEWNLREFGGIWKDKTDDRIWSEAWGGDRPQWFGSILPRICSFIGGDTLEIGCGHGRWSKYLSPESKYFIGVDIAPECIRICRESSSDFARFEVNDGMTFPMVEDKSIDFVFSFDSLVHAEDDVMESYAKEISRVLRPDGVAWIHHSNLFSWGKAWGNDHELPHRRGRSMSSIKMYEFSKNNGMSCVYQEIIGWEQSSDLDCISTIVNAPNKKIRIVSNKTLADEIRLIRRNALRDW